MVFCWLSFALIVKVRWSDEAEEVGEQLAPDARPVGRLACTRLLPHLFVQAKEAVPGGTASLVYGKLFSQVAPQQMLLKGLV